MLGVFRALAGLALAVWFLAGAGEARAVEGRGFGLGLFLGEPTGLTLKGFLADNHALAGYLSWDFTDDAFTAAVDYQFHGDAWFRNRVVALGGFIGLGGKIGVHENKRHDNPIVGVRVPLGLWFQFKKLPLELTLEIVPGVGLAPSTRADVDGGLGLRFYF